MRTTTCGRGLARSLPNQLQGRRGNGRGCSSSSWKETGQSSGNHGGKTLWKVRVAEEKGDAYNDQDCEQQIVSREAVRQAVWDKHLQNPTISKTEASSKMMEELRQFSTMDNHEAVKSGD